MKRQHYHTHHLGTSKRSKLICWRKMAAAGSRFLAACMAGDLATATTIKDAATKDRDWSVTPWW